MAKMVNREKYIFSASIFMNGAGQMRMDAANAYWKSIALKQKVTVDDVRAMLFIPEYRANLNRERYFDNTPRAYIGGQPRNQALGEFMPLDSDPPAPAPAAASSVPQAVEDGNARGATRYVRRGSSRSSPRRAASAAASKAATSSMARPRPRTTAARSARSRRCRTRSSLTTVPRTNFPSLPSWAGEPPQSQQ